MLRNISGFHRFHLNWEIIACFLVAMINLLIQEHYYYAITLIVYMLIRSFLYDWFDRKEEPSSS